MSPVVLLTVVLSLPVVALLIQRAQRRERHALEAMARGNELHFARDDRFRIAGKVAGLLPTPGAADVRVFDLIYGKEGTRYHFIFSVEWTEGALRWKRRIRRVASFSEEKTATCDSIAMRLQLAENNQPRHAQYQSLYANCCAKGQQRA